MKTFSCNKYNTTDVIIEFVKATNKEIQNYKKTTGKDISAEDIIKMKTSNSLYEYDFIDEVIYQLTNDFY